MKKLTFSFLTLSLAFYQLAAQQYLGSGNHQGISVKSSSEYSDEDIWSDTAFATKTITGQGMNAEYYEAARLLEHASIGYHMSHIEDVVSLGIEGWIDDQIASDPEYILPEFRVIEQIIADSIYAETGDSSQIPRRQNWATFNYAWWQVNMTNDDLLRHKVATALSEFLVISRRSQLGDFGDGLSAYYDILLEHAFGNYEDLLYAISTNPCMAFYLTSINNPRTDSSRNIRPDENYAREFMQLFSIGLYELEQDGSRSVVNGQEVPTYDQDDVREMSKIFTGLSYGDVIPNMYHPEAYWGMGIWNADVTVPCKMYDEDDPETMYIDEEQHEHGIKVILKNDTVPAGQTGLEDIADAIEIIFNHPNVGPFVSHKLIQRMIKSNPSPAYISRIAAVFNDNGSGQRGDMAAVIKAILMDPEARECSYMSDDHNSRLKEPFLRYTHFARAVQKEAPNGFLWNINWNFTNEVKQSILASPSVFNFFLPDDTPNGPISGAGLVAPEFKLHDSRTSVGFINEVNSWTNWRYLMTHWEFSSETDVRWDIDELIPMIEDPEAYINWIDMRMMHGNMTDHTRSVLRMVMDGLNPYTANEYREWRVTMAMYMALISPDYAIMR